MVKYRPMQQQSTHFATLVRRSLLFDGVGMKIG